MPVNEGETLVVALGEAIEPAEAKAYASALRRRLESGGFAEVVCDARRLGRVDLAAIDALARMCLVAREAGTMFRLDDPPAGLLELAGLCGLAGVLGYRVAGSIEPGREAKHREKASGVEEERDPPDPIA